MKRGQSAMEFLLLSGFIFVAITVGVGLLYSQGTKTMWDMASAQLRDVCLDIAESSEAVYYDGEPARRTLDVTFPKGIENLEIVVNDPSTGCEQCTEIRFYLKKGKDVEKIICSTMVNITTFIENRSFSPGLKHIQINAIQDFVFINMTS